MGKPPHGDKTLGLEPEICFYTLEDVDDTAEIEEAGIIVVHDSSLTVSKQNLVKKKLPYIDMFNHLVPALFNAMRDLTSGVL